MTLKKYDTLRNILNPNKIKKLKNNEQQMQVKSDVKQNILSCVCDEKNEKS